MAEALLNQSLTEQEQEAQRDGNEGRREEEEERRSDEGGEAREEGRGAAGREEKQEQGRGGEEEREAVGRENQGTKEEKVQREAEQIDEGRGGEEKEGELAKEEERQPNKGGEAGEEERQANGGGEPGEEEERQPDERRQAQEQEQERQAEERREEQGQEGQGQAEEIREEQGQEQEQAEERREQAQGQAEQRREEQAQEQGRQAEERGEEQEQGQPEERREEQGQQGQAEQRREEQGQEQAEERREQEQEQPEEGREEQEQQGQPEERREEEEQPGQERREEQGQEIQPNEERREAQGEAREVEEEEIEFEEDDDDDGDEEEREAEGGRQREERLQPQPQPQNREERLEVVVGGGGGGDALDNRGVVGAVRGVVEPGHALERQDRMQWREGLEKTQVARLTGKDWWQCHLATVKQRMATLHHQNRLFDVVLSFPKYQVEMKAHKLVLAMSSPVLEAMLYGPMSQVADGRPHHLTLAEDLPETFEWLLRYLYRDETKFQGTVQALSVYEAAHKYQMDSLARLCSQYLADSVTPENFPYVFDPAVLYDDTELVNRCYEVAMVQGREVLSCPDLCVLRRPALRALLTIPRLHVDKESYLFRALVQWGWYHLDEGPPPPAKPCSDMLPVRRRLRAVIDEFLPYVRFLAMGLNEFVTEVEGSQLLSPEECMAVVRAMRGTAPAAVLPHFISADDTRRRRGLVTVAVLVSPPSNETLSFEYMEVLSINLMQNLTVSTALHLVRLASTGVCSLREGSVVVWDESGDHVARGVWSGNGCLFRRPVSLAVGRRYSAVLTLKEAWCVLTTTAINVTHKRIVFRGQTQCGGILRLEYMSGTFLPAPSLQRPFPAAFYIIDP